MKAYRDVGVAGLMLLAAGTAWAGDLSAVRLPPAPVLPDFYSWSGVYAGVQAGYSWESHDSRVRFPTVPPAASAGRYHPDTVLGGAHAGFNWQWGSVVLGVEGDVELANARGGFGDPGLIARVQRDWQASLRGRVGYAFDNILVYATGGAAFTAFDYRFHDPVSGFGAATSLSRTGWTLGGGVNYALTQHLILGAEYRYTDFGSASQAVPLPPLGVAAEHETSMHALRASLAYKF